MNKTTKNIWLRYILAPILLVAFLWLVWKQMESRGTIWEQWADFKKGLHWQGIVLLLLAALMAPVNWLTEAYKWQVLLARIEQISLKKAFVSVLSGIAFAFVTPNKTGDFIGRIIFLKKRSRLRGAVASLIGSLAQMVVTFVFGFFGMLYLHLFYPGKWTLAVLLASAIGVAVLAIFYINIHWLSRLADRFKKLRILVISFYLFKRYSRRELWKILEIAFGRFCIYNLQFLILLRAFNAGVPLGSGFILSGLMFWLITVIPTFFVADIGVRGLVTGLVFITPGVVLNSFPVLAASYMLWLINIVLPAVIGGIVAFFMRTFKPPVNQP